MCRFDWQKPVRSFLYTLQKHGFKLDGVHDGDSRHTVRYMNKLHARNEVADIVCSVDDAHVFTTYMYNGVEKRAEFWIVLGNEPEELVCDYWAPGDESGKPVEDAVREFSKRWECVPCPRVKCNK